MSAQSPVPVTQQPEQDDASTVTKSTVPARRSSRVPKKPERYEPEEMPEDDYSGSGSEEEEGDMSDDMSEDSRSEDETSSDCSFIVGDSEIEFSETDEEDEESAFSDDSLDESDGEHEEEEDDIAGSEAEVEEEAE